MGVLKKSIGQNRAVNYAVSGRGARVGLGMGRVTRAGLCQWCTKKHKDLVL